jgi:hypothetical protein
MNSFILLVKITTIGNPNPQEPPSLLFGLRRELYKKTFYS